MRGSLSKFLLLVRVNRDSDTVSLQLGLVQVGLAKVVHEEAGLLSCGFSLAPDLSAVVDGLRLVEVVGVGELSSGAALGLT